MQYKEIQEQIQKVVDFEIDSIKLLGSGMANTAYVVNGTWVFRFAMIGEAKRTLIKEVSILPVIASSLQVGVPNPSYSRMQPDQSYFVGYELLPGEPLERNRFNRLAADIQSQLLHELHDFLIELHAIELVRVPALEEEAYVGAYNQTQRHFHDQLSSVLGPDVVHKIEAVYVAYEADLANRSRGPVVIHSDLKPDHVLFDSNTGHLTGVLDYSDSALGDPDYDFVIVGVFFSEDFLIRLLDYGNERDKARILRKAPF
ncbi:aminoglycoside phosphotransferase family protein [bacterium]|nr:MAG: aminoglycoside phosphotransferase family protein [bacterium]